jgi:hypothetical protein
MNDAMLMLGGIELYKSALVIALGAAACFMLTAALYPRGNLGAAPWLFACADIVLTVLICRFLHYYCHSEQYASFWRAMTRYSVGGYVLVGAVPAALAAAWLTKAAGLTQGQAAEGSGVTRSKIGRLERMVEFDSAALAAYDSHLRRMESQKEQQEVLDNT